MSYKSILVHVDRAKHSEECIEVAIRMAEQHDAHLIALYVQEPFVLPGYLMQARQEINAAQKKAAAEEIASANEIYKKLISNMGCKNTEWRSTIDFPVNAVAKQARYADLVITGQGDSSDLPKMPKDFPAQLVLAADRPVLILPSAGSFLSIGRRILVAWNASREAMRAITDALPLLKRADSVNLIAISPKHDDLGAIPVDDIVLYLARHGVNVEVSSEHVADIDVGNTLLSRAADLSTDLLIMGCYGHSRLREWVLGGATRIILESMTVPVLMSH